MATGPYSWSTTAASNGSADASINFAEGQSPPSLNNSARALMAAVAGWLDSIGGSATYGGSSSDYTITNPATAAWSAYAAGMLIALKANHTNDDTAVNVNVDGLGNVRVKTNDGGDPAIGDIVSGGIYLLAHDGTYLQILNTLAGGSYQPLDATLTAWAGVTFAADKIGYSTAADTFATTDLTSFARTLLDDTTAAAAATTLGLGTGDSPQFTAINLGHASDTTLTRSAAGVAAVEGVDLVSVSGMQTLTNKTITGGTSSQRTAISSETTGALTSASANEIVQCSGNITLPATGMTDGDCILIDPRGTARTITRPAAHTMYIAGVDSATGTTGAHNIVVAMYHGSSKWTLQGSVS